MSWMQKLCEVYDACEQQGLAGKRDENPMLLPLYHTTLRAQLEVKIDQNGNWLPGNVTAVAKNEQETLVMVTEKSASRSSGPAPMPLFDKLVYLAGDYERYCPDKKQKEETAYSLYVEALRQWCASPYAHPDVQAWLRYIEKGCLIADLARENIFQIDEDGQLLDKWAGTGKASDAFVRIRVHQPDGGEEKLWMKSEISDRFIAYQNSMPVQTDLCYAMGQELPVSGMSPKYIRYPGDGAKLVSSNDSDGFTFRGRFKTAEEAFCIGRETTEKAHAALKYLIRRQAYRNGDQVILTFGTGGVRLPGIDEDTAVLADYASILDEFIPTAAFSLKEGLAREVNKAIAGYQSRLDPQAEAIVIGLDSAIEGKGRLSIFYYREMTAEDFFARILKWHTTCAWEHQYRSRQEGTDDNGKPVYRRFAFCGAPAPMDIVEAAYGKQANDKLKKSAVERLVPCIIDSARLPRDIVAATARRAAQRSNMNDKENDKALSVACALIRKLANDSHHEEVWDMALQPEVTDRSYLFGRAWAYAEAIERFALREANEKRSTNAERLMTAFPRHPKRSWGILMERLRPYQQKLGARANALNDGMDAVITALETSGFTDETLDETYLLGYACQRQAFAAERTQRQAAKAAQKEED